MAAPLRYNPTTRSTRESLLFSARDYNELRREEAVTAFSLMTYDAAGSGPGPSAPLDWVSANIEALLAKTPGFWERAQLHTGAQRRGPWERRTREQTPTCRLYVQGTARGGSSRGARQTTTTRRMSTAIWTRSIWRTPLGTTRCPPAPGKALRTTPLAGCFWVSISTVGGLDRRARGPSGVVRSVVPQCRLRL